jgi:diaminopimelate epimerase
MHGLGNDFMVIDAVSQTIDLSKLDIKALADRRTGVGFDQLLLVEESESNTVDFRYRIFNADGGEVEQCGNGARCFARFVQNKALSDKNPLVVETSGGIISLAILQNGEISVDMGLPIFEAQKIPTTAKLNEHNQVDLSVESEQGFATFTVLSMGNPHAVLEVEEFDDISVYTIGDTLQNHSAFPAQVNVGFMQIIDKGSINLRVFERGVGETLACGTGACAAVVAGILQHKLNNCVQVSLPGGQLNIEWQGEGHPVIMQGDASLVYDGELP